jgi:hypothetical protein
MKVHGSPEQKRETAGLSFLPSPAPAIHTSFRVNLTSPEDGKFVSGSLQQNTRFTVWERKIQSIRFEFYSTDAPIEQVLFHWERRHLLPFSERILLQLTAVENPKYTLNGISFKLGTFYLGSSNISEEEA